MGNCKSKRPEDIVFERKVATEKAGCYFFTWPFGIRKIVKRAIIIAEEKKGGPVYLVDVYREWLKITYMVWKRYDVINGCFVDLFKNDEILANVEFNMFSCNPDL